ncbi:ArsR/SmtB family transcription factor [Halobaculum sp. D14]|uniref:ArsR/SmtB family transcription factor n=1 Tax=Halobaculum sp. D14 TaxID=3421642 RepID=UPI003EB93F31
MADILPSFPDVGGAEEREPRVLGVDADDADDVLAALSSDTARQVLATLHDDPGPASDVAGRVDTSLQNAQYHLKRLRDAGLVEVAGTAYSEKGREMDVYAPADRALVLVAGREEDTRGLKSTLTRLLGGVAVVGVGAAVIEQLLGGPFALRFGMASSGGAGGADGTTTTSENVSAQATPTPTATEGGFHVAEATTTAAPTETAVQTTATATSAAPTLLDQVAASPGALFFLGGLVALALAGVWLTRR